MVHRMEYFGDLPKGRLFTFRAKKYKKTSQSLSVFHGTKKPIRFSVNDIVIVTRRS